MKSTDIKIPENALTALDILENAGFEAWCVGGCVRDSLMGRTPHDWDICTNASPEEMLGVFSSMHTIPTGLKHGTITVIISGEQIEITTYRTDGDYKDHRRPEQVVFVRDIKSDLERRDFTINAMCLNKKGELLDIFGGEEDIRSGMIRCVGDPYKRFDEDALRILRAVRFAAKTGFSIEPQTAKAAFEMKGLLDKISAERIYSELKQLLVSPFAEKTLIEYREIIAQIIPEIKPCFDFEQNNPHHFLDVWEHIARSVGLIDPDPTLRTVMLLHDIAKPEMFSSDENGTAHFKGHPKKSAELADVILRRMKSDTESRIRICSLISEHDNWIKANKKSVKKFLSKHGYDFFYDYMKVRRADTLAQSMYKREEKIAELDELLELAEIVKEENSCLKISDLKINGSDLLSLGLCGKEIGRTLDSLLSMVIEENIENDRELLLAYVKGNMEK